MSCGSVTDVTADKVWNNEKASICTWQNQVTAPNNQAMTWYYCHLSSLRQHL